MRFDQPCKTRASRRPIISAPFAHLPPEALRIKRPQAIKPANVRPSLPLYTLPPAPPEHSPEGRLVIHPSSLRRNMLFFRISPSACARRDYIAALFPTRPHACVQLKPGRRICSSYRRLFCSPSACSLGIIGCPASDDRFRKPHLREGCGQLAPCLQAALQLKSVLTPSRLAPDPSQKRALLSRQTIAEQLHLFGPRSLEMWAQLSYSHHWPG